VPFLGHTCFVLAQAKAFPPSPGRRPTFTRAGSRLTLAETPLKTQQKSFSKGLDLALRAGRGVPSYANWSIVKVKITLTPPAASHIHVLRLSYFDSSIYLQKWGPADFTLYNKSSLPPPERAPQ
jgi:hypothetical protein